MNQQATITIPSSTADKLAALGRAMLDLAHEMKEHAGEKKPIQADLNDIPEDQCWFWTPEWQALEKEADEDIAVGRISGPFSTAEELINNLQA